MIQRKRGIHLGRLDFVREEEESADPAGAELDDAVLEGISEGEICCAWEEGGGNREKGSSSSSSSSKGDVFRRIS